MIKSQKLLIENLFLRAKISVYQFEAAKVGSIVDYEHGNRVDGG